MKKWILLFPAVVLCLYSCQQKPGQQDRFTVNGDISGFQDSTYLYLRYQEGDSLHLDSALVKDGQFTFDGAVNGAETAVIYKPKTEKHFQLYLENSDISIKGNADSLDQVKITGSVAQDDANVLETMMKPIDSSMDALRAGYLKAMGTHNNVAIDSIGEKANALHDQQLEVLKRFIQKLPKSYVSIAQFQQLMYATNYKELKSLYDGLSKDVQETSLGEKVGEQLDIMAKTAVGQPAPAFTQNDSTGKAISLADFKGKYVLVDFWASWCGPCRAENPNVVKAYNKYKDKDFTILGVSLDDKKANWIKAINDDGLVWTQVSDLGGWKNEVAAEYGVRAIPANFLIDSKGVIIGHNLRGEKLKNKLKEVLQ